MTETTNDPDLLKTLVYFEKQQQDNIPEEYIKIAEVVSKIRLSFLRRPCRLAKKSANDGDMLTAQRSSRNQQNVYGRQQDISDD